MVDGPGVRWDGYSHQEILDMVNAGPGPALTEEMEARLKSAAKTLTDTADTVNATLQRLNAGEWQGGAANAAAGAMQVVRDFDDAMHYNSIESDINAFGQSDSVRVTRANVPPKVDVGPAPDPTGRPIDIVIATEDYEDQQRASKEAEKRAREDMADYTTVTTDRVSSMPQLSVPPQVVFDISGGTADTPPGGPRPPDDDEYRDAPDGGSPAPRGGAPAPGPGGSSVDSVPSGQPPEAGETPPATTDPARAGSPIQPTSSDTGSPRSPLSTPPSRIAAVPGLIRSAAASAPDHATSPRPSSMANRKRPGSRAFQTTQLARHSQPQEPGVTRIRRNSPRETCSPDRARPRVSRTVQPTRRRHEEGLHDSYRENHSFLHDTNSTPNIARQAWAHFTIIDNESADAHKLTSAQPSSDNRSR